MNQQTLNRTLRVVYPAVVFTLVLAAWSAAGQSLSASPHEPLFPIQNAPPPRRIFASSMTSCSAVRTNAKQPLYLTADE